MGLGKELAKFLRDLFVYAAKDLHLVQRSVTLLLEGELKTRNRQSLETNGRDTLHSKVTCSVMALDDWMFVTL